MHVRAGPVCPFVCAYVSICQYARVWVLVYPRTCTIFFFMDWDPYLRVHMGPCLSVRVHMDLYLPVLACLQILTVPTLAHILVCVCKCFYFLVDAFVRRLSHVLPNER